MALALTLGGVACASNGDGPERADTESIDQTSADAGTPTTTAGGGDGDATTDEGESGGSGGAAGEVLGTAQTQLPTDPGNPSPVPLRADITRLERHGNVVELTIALTNELPASAGSEAAFEAYSTFEDAEGGGQWDASGIGLVDSAGQKLYLPARDSEGNCLCTGDLASVSAPPGETMILTATIGGVPDDLEQIDVAIPGFPTIVAVTIQ